MPKIILISNMFSVFLGYYNHQSAYLCYAYVFGRLCFVVFIKDKFSGFTKFPTVSNPSSYMWYTSDSISTGSSNLVVPKGSDHD